MNPSPLAVELKDLPGSSLSIAVEPDAGDPAEGLPLVRRASICVFLLSDSFFLCARSLALIKLAVELKKSAPIENRIDFYAEQTSPAHTSPVRPKAPGTSLRCELKKSAPTSRAQPC